MVTNRAYININDEKSKKMILDLLNNSFDETSYNINKKIIEFECKSDAFILKMTNLYNLLSEDFNIKISILVVPYFNGIFIKYLKKLNYEITTIYDLFIKEINNIEIRKDINAIYNSFKKQDIDTIKAFINCNCNAMVSANELYLHRNSFNYRLNNFINHTSIDIRNLYSLMFLQLIFSINK